MTAATIYHSSGPAADRDSVILNDGGDYIPLVLAHLPAARRGRVRRAMVVGVKPSSSPAGRCWEAPIVARQQAGWAARRMVAALATAVAVGTLVPGSTTSASGPTP